LKPLATFQTSSKQISIAIRVASQRESRFSPEGEAMAWQTLRYRQRPTTAHFNLHLKDENLVKILIFGVAEFSDDLCQRQYLKFRVGAIHDLPLL
jgi:hypothetical protein